MTTNTAEETMRESFRTIGKRYGYDKVSTEFVAYRDFKVRWSRSYRCIDFQISDYMMDAPGVAFDGLADALFSRILGMDARPYAPEFNDWITSREFTENKQPTYIKRSRNITRSPEGEHRDLRESLKRLKSLGLVEENADPYLTWTKEELQSTVGYSSTLMDTIVISSTFDSRHIPDFVTDFVVYHEYLYIRDGWARFGKAEEINIYEEEKKFPDWKDAEGWVHRLGLHL